MNPTPRDARPSTKKVVSWERDTQVRTDLHAYYLMSHDPRRMLAHVSESTDTFRKNGDLSITVYGDVVMSGKSSWTHIHPILMRHFPDYELKNLTSPIPERTDLRNRDWNKEWR